MRGRGSELARRSQTIVMPLRVRLRGVKVSVGGPTNSGLQNGAKMRVMRG